MGKIADATRTWSLAIEQRRQILAFDTELEDTKTERDDLRAQKLSLEAKVQPLQQQVDGLKKQLEEQTAKAQRAEKLGEFKASKAAGSEKEEDHLDEIGVKLLAAIANSDGRMPKFETGAHFGLNKAQTNYYFSVFLERNFIVGMGANAAGQAMFGPGTDGLKYLAKLGKLHSDGASTEASKPTEVKSVVHDELDIVERTFLSYLASMDNWRHRTTEKVAEMVRRIHPETEMTKLKAEVYLNRLAKRNFVEHVGAYMDSYWDLTMRGKEYVVLHRLEYSK